MASKFDRSSTGSIGFWSPKDKSARNDHDEELMLLAFMKSV